MIEALQERLGYRFADPSLLAVALTHASHAHERGGEDNERLEFLGDAVLQLCTTMVLMERFGAAREGELSRLRARLVNTRALAGLAREIELGPTLRLGIGEETSGGRTKPKILAGALEAVLGAVHRDGGLGSSEALVRAWMSPRLASLEDVSEPRGHRWKDPVSRLQELSQGAHHVMPSYEVTQESGPPHERVYTIVVRIGRDVAGTGAGRSKKEASRAAATAALEQFDLGPEPWTPPGFGETP